MRIDKAAFLIASWSLLSYVLYANQTMAAQGISDADFWMQKLHSYADRMKASASDDQKDVTDRPRRESSIPSCDISHDCVQAPARHTMNANSRLKKDSQHRNVRFERGTDFQAAGRPSRSAKRSATPDHPETDKSNTGAWITVARDVRVVIREMANLGEEVKHVQCELTAIRERLQNVLLMIS